MKVQPKIGNIKKKHSFYRIRKRLPNLSYSFESHRKLTFRQIFSFNLLNSIRNSVSEFVFQVTSHPRFTFNLYIISIGLIAVPLVGISFYQNLHKYSDYSATNFDELSHTIINELDEPSVLGLNTTTTFTAMDKRVFVLEQYFKVNNSPLVGMGSEFVAACDRYGAPVDCISLVAIAKHETDLCNYFVSADMYNCLGWGGGGVYRITFPDFPTMINTATDVLVNQYGLEYMDDPRLMEKVFCGPQDECIGWGARVLRIMDSIDVFSESLGVGRLTDLRDDGLRFTL